MEDHFVDLAVRQACALAAQVLAARPSALVSDLDGTLSHIVSSPEEATVLPGCRRAMERLRDRLDLVAVVSGRPGYEVKGLLGVEGVLYLGNHGLDLWTDGDGPPGTSGERQAQPGRQDILRALEELKQALSDQPGLRFEDKGMTASVHYRLAPDQRAARSRVLSAAAESAARRDLAVGEGKMVVELRPAHWSGKGACLEELARARGLRGLVYMGDDRPDLHAFETLARLREKEGLLTLTIGVAGSEAPPELAQATDLVLAGPEQVALLLEELVEALG